MAFNFNQIVSTTGGAAMNIILVLVAIVIGLVIAGAIFFFIWNKKRWSLNVEVKLPRSDAKIVNSEWAKGYFDKKLGAVFIKRKGMKKIPIKIFDIRRYLQGSSTITVIQAGIEDYRPVLPYSFLTYMDDKTREKCSVLNLKVDNLESKAWRTQFDRASKQAYSLQSFFQQFQTPIAIGIVIICCFVGFAILWSKIPAA